MADVRPFHAIRPVAATAQQVIALPYDVPTLDECRTLAKNPLTFLHVTRSEVDLPEGADPHGEEAYRKAKENLARFRSDGTLQKDASAAYYIYAQTMGEHHQVGILAACSTEDYDAGRIKKHEFTRPDKEDDRTHHMQLLGAQVGLVFLAYPSNHAINTITQRVTQQPAAWSVVTEDGVTHAFWTVPSAESAPLHQAFQSVETLYIADGHHRSAAASRVAALRADEPSKWFLAGLYPDDNLKVLAYNRVVHDLNGHTPASFLAHVDEAFVRSPASSDTPSKRGSFTMYMEGAWYSLTPRDGVVDHADPVARIDAAVLQDHLLGPILGIANPRRSERITFVGGIRGARALARAVDNGAAVAFHLFPTGLDQLFDVADADMVMPPKSTWFEPKLREGVVSRDLSDLPPTP
ncbi:MAG: DUF1015 domain-containing protein [Myxococcota bacterium]